MPKELAKQYAPQGTEDRIYQNWCDKGYFHTPVSYTHLDFTPITSFTFGGVLLAVRLPTSGVANSHGLTGGVYKLSLIHI